MTDGEPIVDLCGYAVMKHSETLSLDPVAIRADFPVLNQTIYKSRRLIYFDNGATTQRPRQVIASMVDCYEHNYANVHRGVHYLSERASELYEQSRNTVAKWINASKPHEVIFTGGTTAAVNLVSRAWGDQNVGQGDEILLTIMEHHSNIVPWQQLAERTGATIQFVGLTEDGHLDLQAYENLLNERTRIVGVSAVSNVLGTINPVQQLSTMAHSAGALVCVDAAQHVPHDETDVTAWDADFVCFSGHKMLGPSGIGVLYGKEAILQDMPPFMGGGSMIAEVTTSGFVPGELPARFEAGTPPIAEAIGLGAAMDYLGQYPMREVLQHEQQLAQQAIHMLSEIDGVQVLGPAASDRAGIVSFVVDGLSTQDIALLLDRKGVAIRSGHHCAMPLHQALGIANSCRASFYIYNSTEEVVEFGRLLEEVIVKLR